MRVFCVWYGGGTYSIPYLTLNEGLACEVLPIYVRHRVDGSLSHFCASEYTFWIRMLCIWMQNRLWWRTALRGQAPALGARQYFLELKRCHTGNKYGGR